MDMPPPPPPADRINGHAPQNQNGRRPSGDEERRGRERERWKHEEKKREAARREAEVERNAKAASAEKANNRLKRQTPFMCEVRFRNDLPQIPCDPKLLIDQVRPAELAAFKLTSLERNPRRGLPLTPDLGIHISVLDVGRYAVPDIVLPMDPEDEALIADDGEDMKLAPNAQRVRERLRGSKAELSWLMHTTYLSADTAGQAAKGMGEKEYKTLRDAATAQPIVDDREAQIASIEASFEAAKRPPVHQKNPSLRPVEILPVLPDMERWPDNYVHISFDNDPVADNPRLAHLSPAQRREYAEQAVVKSYSISVGDSGTKVDRFVAYMVPAEELPRRDANDAAPADSQQRPLYEGQYEWVREYTYAVQNEQAGGSHSYVFRFTPDAVRYLDLGTRLTVQKRSKLKDKDSLQSHRFARPAEITIRKRPANEDEELMRETKIRHLMAELEDTAPATQPESGQPSQPSPSRTATQLAEAAPVSEAGGLGGSGDADEDPLADDSFDDLSD